MPNFRKLFFLGSIFIIGCSSDRKTATSNAEVSDEADFEQRAAELARQIIILDGHIDIPYRLEGKMEDVSVPTESGDFDFVRAKQGGLDAPFMSIYIPADLERTGEAKSKAEKLINMIEKIASDHPDKFGLARSPQDIEANFAQGRISLPMGMENGAPIEGVITNVKYFYDRGIRYITLTHSKDNHICDSSYDTTRTWNGLSPFGKTVVQEMNRVGIMIDVSHISDSAFYQVMSLSRAPVIASHSSCRYFTPGFERNMSDDMVRLLAQNNGVIQINFGSSFISGESRRISDEINKNHELWMEERGLKEEDPESIAHLAEIQKNNLRYADVAEVADHIDHVVNLSGIDFVGLGSDFDGVGNTLPVGLKDVSQYPNLIAELLRRGYTDQDVKKICYENVSRVWNKVMEVSE